METSLSKDIYDKMFMKIRSAFPEMWVKVWRSGQLFQKCESKCGQCPFSLYPDPGAMTSKI